MFVKNLAPSLLYGILSQCVHLTGIQGNNCSLDNTEDSEFSTKCKVKCQNESNVLRRKIKPFVEKDLENTDYHMIFKNKDKKSKQ